MSCWPNETLALGNPSSIRGTFNAWSSNTKGLKKEKMKFKILMEKVKDVG